MVTINQLNKISNTEEKFSPAEEEMIKFLKFNEYNIYLKGDYQELIFYEPSTKVYSYKIEKKRAKRKNSKLSRKRLALQTVADLKDMLISRISIK